MSSEPCADAVDYGLAPALVARLSWIGGALLVLVDVGLGALLAVFSSPPELVVALLAAPMLSLAVCVSWLRRKAYVIRLDEHGYGVGLVRGAGIKSGRWADVKDVVAATPRGIPCLVLRRHDGFTTTIPVAALAVRRDGFAADVRARLEHASHPKR